MCYFAFVLVGPCFNFNGDCEQICVSNGNSRICSCSFGFKLAGNGKSCTSDLIQDNFMLAVDSMDNKLYQISLSNQSVQGINVQDTYFISGIAYNPINNMVIWGTDKNRLSMMNLNDTGKTLLPVCKYDNENSPNSYFHRIAVDYSTGNIYYTAASCTSLYVESFSSCICVMSLNGKYKTLFTKLHAPTGLVVYPSKGRMYYIDNSTNPYIGLVTMDGNMSAVLLNIDYQFPKDLTIDYKTDYLYWIDSRENSIRYCKLDGTNHNKLFQDLSLTFNSLAVYQDSLFISTSGHLQIIKLMISNPNETTAFVAHAELGNIRSISIFTSKDQNKNVFCSVGNGGCSTFCFPIPDGGKCGCEDGMEFKEGSDTICSTARCNDTIPNGSLPIKCNLDIGSTCSYYCDDHFLKNPNISSIQCKENGQWNADVRLLCTKNSAICPDKFLGGSWDICQYRENETCKYICFSGFHKNPNIQNGTCGPDGAWNQNTEKLCRRKCDPGILNGYLTSSCMLEIGETCAFECVTGYKVATSANTVTCGENGLWAPTDLCEAVLCPSTIPNGTVNETACDRHVYSSCPFICNKGFDPNPKYKKVICDMDGKWNDIDKPYCIERKGICVNVFENGKWADDCHFNANDTCAFECDGGFEKNPNIKRNIMCTASAKWNIDLSLLCKENDHGLIVTLIPGQVQTVPTSQDGTPELDYVRSFSHTTDVQFLSVDGDYILHQAYMYDKYTQAIYKNVNFSIGLNGENELTILHQGISNGYVKLAVDWISHNIYWTDPQFKWIMVQSLLGNDNSMFRTLIDDNLNGPHALALDPIDALLFWSDIGNFTKIEVSSLSGRNRKNLISSNLLYPYSLAADHASQHIYFIDAGHETVQTVTYQGKDRKILLRRSDSNFFDIAVFKDYLYVIDTNNYGLCFFNKSNGKELQKSLTNSAVTYYGITVFHPDAQPTPVTEAHCKNHGCEQICVTEKDGASCLCKDGYKLNKDGKSCSLNHELFHRGLVYSNKSSICIVDIRIITGSVFNPKCVLKANGTKFIAIDTEQRLIFLENEIGILFGMVDNPVLHVIMPLDGKVTGLAWDSYDRNLYWTQNDTGYIMRMSSEMIDVEVFLDDLNKPRDLLIVPHERLIYWISDRNGSTIESSNLDGSNRQIVLNSNDLVDPKSLSYDPYKRRIYFLDKGYNGLSYIFSCYVNGSDLIYFLTDTKEFENLEIYKGYLLVTTKDYNGSSIMSYSYDLGKKTPGKLLSIGNISAMRVYDESFHEIGTGPCFNFNGECEHICISNGMSRICECVLGFKLAENGKSCISDPVKDDFMLVGDSTHKNIYQISLMNQTVQGINVRGTYVRLGIAYSPIHDLVIWATNKSEISIMHLNGTGKKSFTIPNSVSRNVYLSRLAVDYSTGNIYYTAMDVTSYSGLKNYVGVLSPNEKHRTLVTGLIYPKGLVVYPSKGHTCLFSLKLKYLSFRLLFYTDNLHLSQAQMDGSHSVILLNFDNGGATELTVDYKTDYLYWINYDTKSIEYCKLDGSNHETLTKYLGIDLYGLALYQDYLFLSTREHSHIIRMKISNPNETTEFAPYAEMGRISDLYIYSSKFQDKNKLCSVENGGCSTFCFPIPAGAVCGCEDGVNFRKGSTTICSNVCAYIILVPSCPEIHSLFFVSTDCLRINGSSCTFTCMQGYKSMPGVDKVLCNGETYSPEYPCEEIKCPATFANGKWVNCSFSYEKYCNYTCNYGYTRNAAVMEVECQTNGKWKLESTDNLCQPVTCPKQFTLGRILSNCTGMLGQQCDYECTGYGYKKNRNITHVKCLETGVWNADTDSLCKPITCPKEIPNGVLLNRTDGQICSAELGMKCDFECNIGFVKLNTVQGLYCLLEGWAEDVQTLCTVRRCPDILNQINVSSDCQRVNGSKCNFTCQQGYKRRLGVDNVLCNGETYTPENPCECVKQLTAKFAPDRIRDDLIPVVDFQMNTTFGPEAESEQIQGLQS
ncbi:hypothetical protein CHS0354_017022 [Potamilus streckersoni]|uniref:Sushi domain-containing protein n=1 Tax=Potamilus streckersoni TaxID=2493646 RepID=A0AAE0W4G5_9BIVA|nr:hypothetical protein CHS0354_017022 [Potamilus streckersoni]